MRNRDEPAHLGVVLYDRAELLDVAGTIGVVLTAARSAGDRSGRRAWLSPPGTVSPMRRPAI
jgi:hypothetical protein